ncbi:MAG: nicotinate-nucleotide--dimethylbenzimidazole phosphoribosyltransferase, partial [Paracoccaceae bacterium]|nr:nicotinate-nucleotide--dimethylbenzimidazole phosphoribosyltransferase [Paracoccaceae bacterium]
QPGALDHCISGHVSAEAAHARLLEKLGKSPLLSLGLRLGEGSGAALAIGVLKAAVACHSDMATFAEAGVAAG